MRNQIISVLIGLANATNNNPKTENTDRVVLEALQAYAQAEHLPNTDAVELIQTTIKKIRREKDIVSPGCATCQSPCGNTSDYNLAGITEAEPGLRELKLAVLEKAAGLARTILAEGEWDEEDARVAMCYKCLSYVGWNLAEGSYRDLLK